MIKKSIIEYRTEKFESAVVRNDSGLYSMELPDSFGKEKLRSLVELLTEVLADNGETFRAGESMGQHTPSLPPVRKNKPALIE